ncbi:MAG: MFS transporter [Woeseiaceae bacterium]|nr:MFS transporter [Woeseiaceae bacterium]
MSRDFRQIIGAMLPDERRAVGVIALIAIFRMFGLFALLPVLAIFAADLENATPTLIGIAVGGYGLTQAALQIPFGALSDRIGRIPVILLGLILFAAGSILAAVSDDIAGVIAGRFLQGAGAISATLVALLADATREEVRTRSMAIFGMGIGSSFLLSLILGPVIAAAFGVRALFWMAAGLAVAAAVMTSLLPGDIALPEKPVRRNIAAAFRPDLLRLDLYIFVLHVILTACFVALPFLLRNELGVALDDHWEIYIGALLVSLVGTIPLIFVDERQGKPATVAAAILLLLIGLSILALAGSTTMMVFAALAIFFAGFNFLEAGLPARLSMKAAGEVRGAALGVFSSAQFLGAFAGGLIGGYFLSGGNPATVFLVAAMIAAAWFAFHRIGQ